MRDSNSLRNPTDPPLPPGQAPRQQGPDSRRDPRRQTLHEPIRRTLHRSRRPDAGT